MIKRALGKVPLDIVYFIHIQSSYYVVYRVSIEFEKEIWLTFNGKTLSHSPQCVLQFTESTYTSIILNLCSLDYPYVNIVEYIPSCFMICA